MRPWSGWPTTPSRPVARPPLWQAELTSRSAEHDLIAAMAAARTEEYDALDGQGRRRSSTRRPSRRPRRRAGCDCSAGSFGPSSAATSSRPRHVSVPDDVPRPGRAPPPAPDGQPQEGRARREVDGERGDERMKWATRAGIHIDRAASRLADPALPRPRGRVHVRRRPRRGARGRDAVRHARRRVRPPRRGLHLRDPPAPARDRRPGAVADRRDRPRGRPRRRTLTTPPKRPASTSSCAVCRWPPTTTRSSS